MDWETLGVSVSVPSTSARQALCSGQAERVHLGVDLPEHREPPPPVLVWDTGCTAHHSLCVSTSDPCMPFPIQETRQELCGKWLIPELCESLWRPSQDCV